MSQTQQVRGVATTIHTGAHPEDMQVWYHGTCVVEFNPARIRLHSGGWRTATTKLRMNQASNQFKLGYSVYQKNHAWLVDFNGQTLPFEDGMILQR
jgi:hypothetical protein